MRRDANRNHRDKKRGEREGQCRAYRPAKNIEIETQACFEQDDDESYGCEHRTYGAEVFRLDEMEDRPKKQANNGQKKNVGDAGPAEEACERVRDKDQRTDYQDICRDRHNRLSTILFHFQQWPLD